MGTRSLVSVSSAPKPVTMMRWSALERRLLDEGNGEVQARAPPCGGTCRSGRRPPFPTAWRCATHMVASPGYARSAPKSHPDVELPRRARTRLAMAHRRTPPRATKAENTSGPVLGRLRSIDVGIVLLDGRRRGARGSCDARSLQCDSCMESLLLCRRIRTSRPSTRWATSIMRRVTSSMVMPRGQTAPDAALDLGVGDRTHVVGASSPMSRTNTPRPRTDST